MEGPVDAYLAPLNGPPYDVSTGRVCSLLIAFPSRDAAGPPFRVAPQGSRTGERAVQVKRVKRAHKGRAGPRPSVYARNRRRRRFESNVVDGESKERKRKRESKTIQGLILAVPILSGKTCLVVQRAICSCPLRSPFSTFSPSTRCAVKISVARL